MNEKDRGITPDNELNLGRHFLDMRSEHQTHLMDSNPKRNEEISVSLQFSDLKEWIYDDELSFKAAEAFSLWRLGRIKQLSFLAYVGPSPETQHFMQFDHTRLEHTGQVVKIGEAILKRNNATEKDINLYTISASLHDIATPALGDAAKKIDKENLNEEDFWSEGLREEGFKLIKEYGLKTKDIDDVIHNNGIIGQILDISDRMSYVMLDLSQIISAFHLNTEFSETEGYREEISKVLLKDTNVGSIYRDVVIDFKNNDFYFTNPERLSKFLELRALLNKYLYQHPVSQARDMLVVDFLKPYYTTDETNKDKLTPQKLRAITDENALDFLAEKHPELEESVYKSLGRKLSMEYSFEQWYPQYWEKFDSKKEAESKKHELEDNNFLVRGFVESFGFDPLTHYKVLNDKGEIVPFKDYDPVCALRIERIEKDTKGFIIFWEDKGRDINDLTKIRLDSGF